MRVYRTANVLDHFTLMPDSSRVLYLDLLCFLSSSMILPDVNSSQIGIYADGTTIFSWLNNKSDMSVIVKLTADLEHDLQSVVIKSKKWLENWNDSKTKCCLLVITFLFIPIISSSAGNCADFKLSDALHWYVNLTFSPAMYVRSLSSHQGVDRENHFCLTSEWLMPTSGLRLLALTFLINVK